MRTAFPYMHVQELNRNFEYGFLILGCILLSLSSFITWFIIYNLTAPIQNVINSIKPYQEGSEEHLPHINIEGHENNDFVKLGETLNKLSKRVQLQIDHITLERNEKSSILDSLVEGVISLDKELKILYTNRQAVKFLKLDNKKVLNTSLISHHTQESNNNLIMSCHRLIETCQQKEETTTETISLNSNRIIFDLIALPQKNGTILVLQDQSSHYKMIEMRKDFIANASHELKTPITIIRGFAETLRDYDHFPRETVEEITEKSLETA